jgi:hypothetical protein
MRNMKKFPLLMVLFWIFNACEKPSDCVESTGAIIVKDVPVQPFKRIKVYRGIEVVITEGAETKVQIEAGENFISNVEVTQNGDQLIFKDDASCNWVRSYGRIRILVTTPTLEEVYSKTDRNISSNGVLTFPYLSFVSMDKDGDGESGAGTGDFILNVNNDYLNIANNNVSRFYLSGQTNTANFNFYFGDGRIEAQNLIAQHMLIYHRGSNDMIVHPIQSLIGGELNGGGLFSTGNLISLTYPPIHEPLPVHYIGKVIYP